MRSHPRPERRRTAFPEQSNHQGSGRVAWPPASDRVKENPSSGLDDVERADRFGHNLNTFRAVSGHSQGQSSSQPIQAKRRKKKLFDKKNALFHGSLQDFHAIGGDMEGISSMKEEGRRLVNEEGYSVPELRKGLKKYGREAFGESGRHAGPRAAERIAGQLERSEYKKVSRFARKDHPEDLYSPLGKFWTEKGKPEFRESGPWRKGKTETLLKRAGRHMAGTTDKSPFASTAENVESLLTHGDSWVSSIAFGAGDPQKRASHIGSFKVPRRSLYTPEDVREGMIEQNLGLDLHRSTLETEALYHGDDLGRYLESWRKNPYTPKDMTRYQGGSEEEED